MSETTSTMDSADAKVHLMSLFLEENDLQKQFNEWVSEFMEEFQEG